MKKKNSDIIAQLAKESTPKKPLIYLCHDLLEAKGNPKVSFVKIRIAFNLALKVVSKEFIPVLFLMDVKRYRELSQEESEQTESEQVEKFKEALEKIHSMTFGSFDATKTDFREIAAEALNSLKQ